MERCFYLTNLLPFSLIPFDSASFKKKKKYNVRLIVAEFPTYFPSKITYASRKPKFNFSHDILIGKLLVAMTPTNLVSKTTKKY